jgi:hypothetical protein
LIMLKCHFIVMASDEWQIKLVSPPDEEQIK